MEAGLGSYFPDRRKSVPGGCEKNVLFFTLRKIAAQSSLPCAFPLIIVRAGGLRYSMPT